MPTISDISARQIIDSRGQPTVEAVVTLSDGTMANSSTPTGAQINPEIEAATLRDSASQDFFGLGVTQAVKNIETEIKEALIGQDPLYQTKVDQTLVNLDGTKNKSRLGGNAILAVSQAVIKAAANSLKLPLFVYVKEKYQLIDAYRIPTPIFNLLNGGRHGGGTLDFQEFQLVPASHLPYSDALKIGVEMFMAIEKVLKNNGAITNVGLEGGFSPNLANNIDALQIFQEAAKMTRYALSKDAFLGIDLGPDGFYKSNKYTIKDKTQPMNTNQFIEYLQSLHEDYRVFAFEDPLVVSDWSGWKKLTAELGRTAMILADDLVLTNKTLLMKAIAEKAANSLVVKPNRAGTVTETIELVSIAKNADWHTVMSHRSGETNDDILADIAVGIGTEYVKFGAPSRGERVAKYNRLIRIEEILRASRKSPTMETQNQGRTTMANSQTNPQPEPQNSPASPAATPTNNQANPVTPNSAAASGPINPTTPPTTPQNPLQQPPTNPVATQPATPPLNPAAPVQRAVDDAPTVNQPSGQAVGGTPTPSATPAQPSPVPATPELKIDSSSNNQEAPIENIESASNPTTTESRPTAPTNPAPQPTFAEPALAQNLSGAQTSTTPPTQPAVEENVQEDLNELANLAADSQMEPTITPKAAPDLPNQEGLDSELPKPTPPINEITEEGNDQNSQPTQQPGTPPAGLQPPIPPTNN